MINIEKFPTVELSQHYRAECTCGCIFTFDDKDKRLECFGHGDYWEEVRCPICGKEVFAPWSKTKVSQI